MATYQFLDSTNADGTILGQSTTSLIGFYGATPAARVGGTITAIATTAAVISSSASAWCYSSSAQANAIITGLNSCITKFTALGL